MHKRHVRVSASSANLGPGFDALGLALGLYLDCGFERAERLRIRVSGRDAESISTGEDNLIWQTALRVARDLGRSLEPIDLDISNEIPLGKGLGSSAAALTAGVVIADQLLGLEWDAHRILDEAARIEGHPDNVAACVLGSIVASAIDSEGVTRAVRLNWPSQFRVAVIVPDYVLKTSEARTVLPGSYSREDTVFNVQRSALLVAALATGDATVFPAALEDRLHQPCRAHLVPGLDAMIRLRAPGLLGCALSGAGPSVLVFYQQGQDAVCELVAGILRNHDRSCEILRPAIAASGYSVT